MLSLLSEWSYLPGIILELATSGATWLFLLIGVVVGFFVGVMPGLGPTMGMALMLGVVYKIPVDRGLALMMGVFVAAVGSGGITASLINIPGTAAAAATCMDGYAMTKQGKGKDACGYSIFASVLGTIMALFFIFLIQPFVTTIALKFGDWETFLFCLFGLSVCASLSGGNVKKGWIGALVGFFLAMCGIESVQSVSRYTFGRTELLSGFNSVVAMLGLFGIGEVLYCLRNKESIKIRDDAGLPRIHLEVFARNVVNVIRSCLAGIWIGFIPGIGESAACWFSYDIARRSSKHREEFGNGSPEGIIAAEVANNSSSIGALIPALALGIPGSSTVAIFISALYLMGYRPGPTLLMESPGFLCKVCVLGLICAVFLLIVAYFGCTLAIRLLSIPESLLMPLIAVFCVVGAYGTTNTPFALVQLLIFGILGLLMKTFHYPIAPMILGLLVGGTADSSLRRALTQYDGNIIGMVCRPFGLAILVVLLLLLVMSVKSSRISRDK